MPTAGATVAVCALLGRWVTALVASWEVECKRQLVGGPVGAACRESGGGGCVLVVGVGPPADSSFAPVALLLLCQLQAACGAGVWWGVQARCLWYKYPHQIACGNVLSGTVAGGWLVQWSCPVPGWVGDYMHHTLEAP